MRASRVALFAVTILLLQSCSPASLIDFYNDSGDTIVVTALDRTISVAPHSSTQFDFVLARGQHWESVSVTRRGKTWRYPQKLFSRIPWESWQRGPFESRRAFVSVDSHDKIYLRSPSGALTSQPAGFPLSPEKT
jgi:hypothetical protein